MRSCCGEKKTSVVTDTDFHQLDRFVAYTQKRFDLSLLAGCFGDSRQDPDIPSRAVGLSLVLGEVVKIPWAITVRSATIPSAMPATG